MQRSVPSPRGGEGDGASLGRDGSGRWRGGGGIDLAVAHRLRHLLFLHIHGAKLCVDRRLERGIGLHAAAGGQLEIAIPANGERRPAPGLQNIQRHAAAVQAQIDLALRQLGYGGGGLQNAALGEGAELSDIDRRRRGAQLE